MRPCATYQPTRQLAQLQGQARVLGRRRPCLAPPSPSQPGRSRPHRPGPSSPVHLEVLLGEDVLYVVPEVPEGVRSVHSRQGPSSRGKPAAPGSCRPAGWVCFYSDACRTQGREGPAPPSHEGAGPGAAGVWLLLAPGAARIPQAPRRLTGLTGSRPHLSRSPAAPGPSPEQVPAPREAPMLDGPLKLETKDAALGEGPRLPALRPASLRQMSRFTQDPKPLLQTSLVSPQGVLRPRVQDARGGRRPRTLTCTGSQSASPPTGRPSASPRWTPAGDGRAEREGGSHGASPAAPTPRVAETRPSATRAGDS